MATPEEMAAAMKANLREKTGKTLTQWLKVVRASGVEKHGQIVKLLKAEHGMTHGFANVVAHEALQSSAEHVGPDDLVSRQYGEKKAALRPIYEALIQTVGEFGNDVEIAPKKAYVSLRRSKQFALIQPSTASRVDVGLCMKGEPATARLEESGSFNAMCSHRVRVSSVEDLDGELYQWLRRAYDRS